MPPKKKTPKATPKVGPITRSQQSTGTPVSSRRAASASATTMTPKKRAHDQKKWTDPRNKQAEALLKALVDPVARNKGYQGVRMLYPDIGGHDDRAAEKVWTKKKKDPKYWEEAREILERNPSPDRAPPAPLGVVQHGTLSGLHLDAAAGAAGAAGNGFSALSISGGGDGVNRQLFTVGGAAGAWDRGTGGGGYGAAGRTPVRHRHIVEASPHILSPKQKVAMEQAKAERAVAEAEAAKDRKERAVAEAEAAKDRKEAAKERRAIATALGTLCGTVNQHTGQIGDLQGEQKALKADNLELRGQLTQQGEEQYQLGQEVGELQETADEYRRRLDSIEQHSRLLVQIFMRVAECAIGMGQLPDDLKSSALGQYSKLERSGLDSHQDYLFTSVQWNSDSSLVSKGIGNCPEYRWELESFVVMTTEDFGEQQEGPFRGSTHVVVKRPVHAFKLPFPVEEAPLRCQYIYPPLQRFTQINILEFKDEDVDHWYLGAFRVDGEKTFILVEENFSFHGFGGEECG